MTTADLQLHLQKLLLLGTFFGAAIFIALLLAGAPILLIWVLAGFAWLLLLPYHAEIAITLSLTTFASGFIVPGFPGRPLVWEAAAFLGWTGVMITLAMRQYSSDFSLLVRRNRLLFVGVVGYCAVLLLLMHFRGVGIRVFGGSQMGGRIYLQQLVCAIFPVLFALKPLSEKRILTLYVIQCLLTLTFLPADFAFSFGGDLMRPLLYVLELPTDGLNFEAQAQQLGIRRFQSFFHASMGLICLLLTFNRFTDFFRFRGLWLWPITLGLVGTGLLGGHRNLLYQLVFIVVIGAWAQRWFTFARAAAVTCIAGFLYLAIATNVRELPLAAQRALSVVPGMQVDRQAEDDGRATLEGRKAIRKAGLEVSKDYRWIGRGFGKPTDFQIPQQLDMTQLHVDFGIFYNGTVGLLVNTGLPGTVAMFSFLGAGSWLAFRILRHIRLYGAEDSFSRMACVLSSLWIGQVFSFIFLHGDAEFAMRTFGLEAGMLLLCDHHLGRRLAAAQAVPVIQPVEPQPPSEPARKPTLEPAM